MFSSTLTFDDADGTDIAYGLIQNLPNGTVRLDQATSLAAPGKMKILHSTTGKGKEAIDRHLVQFTRTIVSGTESADLTVNFTLAVPRNTIVTEAIVVDQVANLLDFLADGSIATLTGTNVKALMKGES